jgi:Flp pilus assembly protein TadD
MATSRALVASVACAIAVVSIALPSAAQRGSAPAPRGGPVAAGCERAGLGLPRPTDARGAPVTRWAAPPNDRVAREGEEFLRAFDSGAAGAVAAREAAVRTWAAGHADHPVAHFVLGRMFSALGRRDEALASYARALGLAPGLAEAEYNTGVVLGEAGRTADAIVHFERATAIAPDDFDAHYNAGMAHYLRGAYDRALGHWCACRRITPDSFDAAKKVVQALHGLGRFADAERARAAARNVRARSAETRVRQLRSYVIDQRRVGDEDVMVEEVLEPGPPSLQHFYSFICTRGSTRTRTVTLESSAVIRERGVAAVVGVELPNGSHATTNIGFRTMPTYQALRPAVDALIARLQRGDTSAIGASSARTP